MTAGRKYDELEPKDNTKYKVVIGKTVKKSNRDKRVFTVRYENEKPASLDESVPGRVDITDSKVVFECESVQKKDMRMSGVLQPKDEYFLIFEEDGFRLEKASQQVLHMRTEINRQSAENNTKPPLSPREDAGSPVREPVDSPEQPDGSPGEFTSPARPESPKLVSPAIVSPAGSMSPARPASPAYGRTTKLPAKKAPQRTAKARSDYEPESPSRNVNDSEYPKDSNRQNDNDDADEWKDTELDEEPQSADEKPSKGQVASKGIPINMQKVTKVRSMFVSGGTRSGSKPMNRNSGAKGGHSSSSSSASASASGSGSESEGSNSSSSSYSSGSTSN
mmetsp:Transcript_12755/g.39149  ORF Transcript_12755/g.39149 Transcript_12755/m.39149 type:complete len:335 (-) Transcript_12755:217-1221(-)|eukprot:CAMPEP_0198728262 /NCGR_PEP_ID=MMETSP1475-20131203/8255_1 /TAXON_ID= ORGANISM="Unidentified sp., Strain CCMP1999" /NCGR_SAMPLE_ID=MMETSP1475 /ASSEMBLY_ACC=CAM_ASM_001111 /LENGTH=334 /DNA_ID=CAMNT_0044490575 /DNA_START=147 /DNA_END=1151 /DNA_ORIENTATION=-